MTQSIMSMFQSGICNASLKIYMYRNIEPHQALMSHGLLKRCKSTRCPPSPTLIEVPQVIPELKFIPRNDSHLTKVFFFFALMVLLSVCVLSFDSFVFILASCIRNGNGIIEELRNVWGVILVCC
jgi:hypothetical protein